MGKSKKAKQPVVAYFLPLHLGVCAGKLDVLRDIRIGGKSVGFQPMFKPGSQTVSAAYIFGGPKKEGGVGGVVTYLDGDEKQKLPKVLAQYYGGTPDTVPGYRGMTSLLFTGSGNRQFLLGRAHRTITEDIPGSETAGDLAMNGGFYFVSNNPYLKEPEVTGSRYSDDWLPAFARIGTRPGGAAGANRQIWIGLDTSGSMAGAPLDTAKAALTAFADRLGQIIRGGIKIHLRFTIWNTGNASREYPELSADDLDDLRAYISGINTGGGTDFSAAFSDAKSFFDDELSNTDLTSRLCVFLSDAGASASGVSQSQSLMADILDRSSGSFSTANDTAVDCYSINMVAPDTSLSALFDNTPGDGVPVVPASNPELFLDVLDGAVFTDRNALDSNPVHIIRELLTNTEWGGGTPASRINDDSFTEAAIQLYAEGLGLSFIWARETKVESMIEEVLDHIEGHLYENPRTGLFEINLVRGGYDVGELRVLDESNARVIDIQEKLWSETINEIQGTWTDPADEKEKSVTVRELGNIAIQGQVKSDQRKFYAVRRPDLCVQLCARDLRTASLPLKSLKFEIGRRAWDLLPGEPVIAHFPKLGIENLVVRIGPIDYGEPKAPSITANGVEDVFASPDISVTVPPDTAWTSPATDPAPLANAQPFTLPLYFQTELIGEEGDYPEVYAGVAAERNALDSSSFAIHGPVVDSLGNAVNTDITTANYTSRSQTRVGLEAEVATVLESDDFDPPTLGRVTEAGDFVMLGAGGDADMELAQITDFTDGDLTLRRGVLDTVPRAWPTGTPMWFVSTDINLYDPTTRADTEVLQYQLLPQTNNGQLDPDDAPVLSHTLTGRPHLPYRPADLKVEGVGFGLYDNTAGQKTELEVTWATRNRDTEETQILPWDSGSVAPETGQTTVLTVEDVQGNLISEVTGITGTSYLLPTASFGANSFVYVRAWSELDGLRSLQGHAVGVALAYGYGTGYGSNYGGNGTGYGYGYGLNYGG